MVEDLINSENCCDLSIISPVYNEQKNLNELYERIKKVLPAHLKWELLLIDDGSRDLTQQVIREICSRDKRVCGIFLSRNYGHQIALTAGYDAAKGRIVISLDGDLQHPPEVIPQILSLWEQGYDIVYARRKIDHKKVGWFKGITSRLFYRIMRKVFRVNLVEDVADFRLMTRKVVEHFLKYRESTRFLRGIVGDLGFKYAIVDYNQDIRRSGETKYNLRKMIGFALNGITSFSNAPLRVSTIIGLIISSFSIIYAAWIMYYKVVYGVVSGLASIMVGIFFIGGVQLISIGILGEYIANIFTEVKRRPLYCISDIVGKEEKDISNRDHRLSGKAYSSRA